MTQEKLETVCQLCIFATHNDKTDPLLQTGCLAGEIDRFKKEGIELKEYVDDDDRKFYGIPDRICLYFRTKEWLNSLPNGENLLLVARDEITLRMEAIIYIDEDSDFKDIGITVDSLSRGKIKPTCIIFCDHQNIRPSTFRKWVEGRCTKTAWRAEHIRETEADFYRCIDVCMKKASGRYTAIFRAGFYVPDDFISELDIALNDKYERFLYLKPCDDSINGTVIQNAVNANLSGNKKHPLLDKIERKVLEQECPHMIRRVDEIIPSMKYPQSQLLSRATITPNL